ncbi:MAG TPA: hypothetical protein VNZ67_05135 [bacterium]|nr:hypothetical protein [bacterium]
MKTLLPALLLALAAMPAPAAEPSSLYPTNKPLYPTAPAYLPTVQPVFAPTPVLQPTSGPNYAPTPALQPAGVSVPAPAAGAASAPSDPSTYVRASAPAIAGQTAAPPNSQQAAAQVVPVGAPAAYNAPQGGALASQPANMGMAPPQAAAPSQAYVQAIPAALPSDPWRRSQQVLGEISARERDGSLAPEKAVALRAELEGLRGGSGLRKPSDARHLSASERRYFLRKLKAEDAEIRKDASQRQP